MIIQFYEDVPGLADGQLLHLIPYEKNYDESVIRKLDAEGLVDMYSYPPGDQEDLISKPWPKVPFSPFVYVEFPHGPYRQPELYCGEKDDYTREDFPGKEEIILFFREMAYAKFEQLPDPEPDDIETYLDKLAIDSLRIQWTNFYSGPGKERRG